MTSHKMLITLLLGLLLQACGQTGALYMPDDNPPPVTPSKQDQQ